MRSLFISGILSLGLVMQAKAQTGSISGKVTDDKKQPIENAIVSAMQNTMPKGGTTTDKDGNYTIKNLPIGHYDVKARNLDYNARFLPGIAVNADKTTTLDFVLYPKTVPQPVKHP